MPDSKETSTVSVKLPKSPAAQGPSSQQPTASPASPSAPPSSKPVAVPPPAQPCLFSGVTSAVSAGMLGFFFGAIPSMAKHRSFAARGMWAADGWKSAKALALVSGMYTWVQCLSQRIRLKDDGVNRGIAGCSTGLVLGFGGGPSTMAQSCLGFGFISYILGDLGGGSNDTTPPADAAMLPSSCSSSSSSNQGGSGNSRIASSSSSSSSSSRSKVAAGVHKGGRGGSRRDSPSSAGSSDEKGLDARCQGMGAACGGGEGSVCSSSSGCGCAPPACVKRVGAWSERRWHQQQRQRQQRLPPVMWLGAVMQPAYFRGGLG